MISVDHQASQVIRRKSCAIKWFDIFLKKEKRRRRLRPYQWMLTSHGVFRFDGHLTDAIYVLKSTGRFILIKLGVLPIPQLP
jgi:hypothetical protein